MSCCCYVTPSRELLEGTRKKEPGGGGEEENMDTSLLRHQYRCSRDRQKRRTQVLVFRTALEDLSEAVSVVPVTQGLTSPWEPNGPLPLAVTFDPNPTIYDPWHVHLDLHRRRCPTASCSTFSRCSWSSSEAVDSLQDLESPFSCTTEEDHFNPDGSRPDPETAAPVQVCASDQYGSRGARPDASFTESPKRPAAASLTGSAPVASPGSLHGGLGEEEQSEGGKMSAWGASGGAPALRYTRQLSSSNQIYQPFPHRKPPRISEAARRLGMYSSF